MSTIRKHGLLGKRPPNVAARRAMLKFGDFFSAANLPTPPAVFGQPGVIPEAGWGMLGNDTLGDCVIAGGMHAVMYWNALAGRPAPRFTTQDAIDDYAGATGYVPGNPLTDQGTDMAAFATYFKSPGLRDAVPVRHAVVDACVSVTPGNWDDLMLAMYLFDGAGIGVNLPASAETQFDQGLIWSFTGGDIVGGHYLAGLARNSAGNGVCVTWGRLQAFNRQWFEQYNDEINAYISLEVLNAKGLSPEGYDQAGLEAAIAALPQ